ncbi:MAG TPA: TMEM43 family protein [Xanthobacteraceae bacterium]|nr:TMEM43 family protein [Xanthobacteraceae bacterium]
MSDSFTEVTTKSWGSRLGDSIKGVLFGLVLIVGSCIFLFWNEGRAVQTQRSLTEGASLVVSVDPARVDPANDGKLVHLSGDLKPGAPLTDPDFTVTATALRLVRTVEMYQWKEETKTETRKNVGGSEETVTTYEYIRTWSDSRIDSSRFKRPEGHINPQMQYRGASYASRDATLGAFRPGTNVIDKLPASQNVSLDPSLAEKLAGRIKGPVHIADGRIFVGESPSQPRIGDLRVSFQLAPAGPTSIIGQQAGTGFAAYQTKAGDPLLMVRPGTLSAADMFAAAQRENSILTWILRFAGVLAMFIGFMMILAPLVVVADVVPFIGNILSAGSAIVSLVLTAIVAPVVIAVAWFWYRPLVSAAVLAVGLVLAYGFKRWASQRAAARKAAQPATA